MDSNEYNYRCDCWQKINKTIGFILFLLNYFEIRLFLLLNNTHHLHSKMFQYIVYKRNCTLPIHKEKIKEYKNINRFFR